VVVEPESTNPFTLGLIGFGITIAIGIILITTLLLIQRKRKLD
jgi:CHASE1-domain containing sensor protein